MLEYFVLGVLAPSILNLMHMVIGIIVTLQRGSVIGLGFSAMGFLTKSIGMLFLTWLGVAKLGLDYQIYVPILVFFWFFTHVVEAFVIQHYMKQNETKFIKSIQI